MTKLFFSYSHADEALRDQLEKHLSGLKRQGVIEPWHDRRLVAGTEFNDVISNELEAADVILLLVSSNFLASDYCYSLEMHRALERHEANDAVVIPVILKSCDWKSAPFAKLAALPTDAKAITSWANHDEAFTNVAIGIRHAVEVLTGKDTDVPSMPGRAASPFFVAHPVESSQSVAPVRSSNLRLRKEFSERDRDGFMHDSFEHFAVMFEGSLKALEERNAGIETTFRRVDADTFIAMIYRDGKKVSECCIRLGGFGGKDITYSNDASARGNSFNESLGVQSDDQTLFFRPLMGGFHGRGEARLSAEAAGEHLWAMLIERLQ